jgi:battenin
MQPDRPSLSETDDEVERMPCGHEDPGVLSLTLTFWLLGLFNNASYVIMIASAKTISEGGTGMVFLANIVPSMLIKLTAPYWFDYVSYERRMLVAFACMVCSLGMVAASEATVGKLAGVLLGSIQGGLGEASLLAAAGKCDMTGRGRCITGFASGTGFAGIFGFLWKFVLNEWMACSMATTLWLAQSIAVLYIGIFWKYLHPHLVGTGGAMYSQIEDEQLPLDITPCHDHPSSLNCETEEDNINSSTNSTVDDDLRIRNPPRHAGGQVADSPNTDTMEEYQQSAIPLPSEKPVHQMSLVERTQFVINLWPYIIPLFIVYATEYSLQAGTWTAIGFPVESQQARNQFYGYSNWMYQAGVFVSRSSGMLGTVPMSILWIMPTLQAVNVGFFALVAAKHIWYNYTLLIPCFYVGLLGGGVYVNGYKRICADFGLVDHREFALAATSVAESFGIVCADVLGLFIQACLYQINGIEGAVVSCPIPKK